LKELLYFVKWGGCSEDENSGEPPGGLERPGKKCKNFIGKSPKCLGRIWLTRMKTGFYKWTSKHFWYLPLP